MIRWTSEEDELIATYARLGARGIRREIRTQTGISRTEAAIVKRASRLGVSLTTYEVCPKCGAVVKQLGKKGMCSRCEAALHIQVEKYVIDELMREEVRMDESSRRTLAALRRKAERTLLG